MNITVKLFATLRAFNSEKIFPVEVPEDASIETIIKQIDVPIEEVAIIMVNGIGKKKENTLKEGDVLALFPAVGGG